MATAKRKRVKWKAGDILRIDLEDGRYAYAQVAVEPLIIFFEGSFTSDVRNETVPHLPVAFRLWVFHRAKGLWPVVGHASLTEENAQEPFFYKQDVISGRLSLHHSSFAATNYARPAILAECEGLECAAVWESDHVVDRLRDHFAGRSNKWADSLKIKTSAIP